MPTPSVLSLCVVLPSKKTYEFHVSAMCATAPIYPELNLPCKYTNYVAEKAKIVCFNY
jgi:hypothetical protein